MLSLFPIVGGSLRDLFYELLNMVEYESLGTNQKR